MAFSTFYPITRQKFPFLAPMMSHIYAQRSATLHSQLIQTCKYFYVKDPIVVIKKFSYNNGTLLLIDATHKGVYLDADKLSCKLWSVSENLRPDLKWALFAASLYRYESNELYFINQIIQYSDLKLLAAKGNCKRLEFFNYNVVYSDETPVPIEYIFELFSNEQEIWL